MKRKARRDSTRASSCTCKWLERAADDPGMPIEWDRGLREYHLIHGTGRRWHATLWFCPSCGGAAPQSKRALLFARVDDAETSRLHDLTKTLKTEARSSVDARLSRSDLRIEALDAEPSRGFRR